MLPRLGRLLGGVLLALYCQTGCAGLFSSHGLPEDPLFLNRKPLESKAISAPPVLIAHVEPLPPPNPYFAESRPASYAGPRAVPGTLTGRSSATDADGQEK